jgi:hypothetical protein
MCILIVGLAAFAAGVWSIIAIDTVNPLGKKPKKGAKSRDNAI